MHDPRTAEGARLAAGEVAARAEIKRCSAEIKDRSNPNDPATRCWKDAIARWHLALDRVYPESFWSDVAALKQARHLDEVTGAWVWRPAPAQSIETAVRFLEADLDCFRSGYVKERLIRHLVRQTLGDDVARRLRSVVLAALDHQARREFRALCRLAVRVADDDLRTQIGDIARSDNPDRARRAGWVRDAILEKRADGHARQRPPAPR